LVSLVKSVIKFAFCSSFSSKEKILQIQNRLNLREVFSSKDVSTEMGRNLSPLEKREN